MVMVVLLPGLGVRKLEYSLRLILSLRMNPSFITSKSGTVEDSSGASSYIANYVIMRQSQKCNCKQVRHLISGYFIWTTTLVWLSEMCLSNGVTYVASFYF